MYNFVEMYRAKKANLIRLLFLKYAVNANDGVDVSGKQTKKRLQQTVFTYKLVPSCCCIFYAGPASVCSIVSRVPV